MLLLAIDWWFQWMQDGEVLRALIPAMGYVFVGAITWIGIWRTSKIAKQTLEDTREATPPKLLRLEKWSKILKDMEQYPESLKNESDMEIISDTYRDILAQATIENKVTKLGIMDKEVREELFRIDLGVFNGTYPKPKWKFYRSQWIEYAILVVFGMIYTTFSFIYTFITRDFSIFIIFALSGVAFTLFSLKMLRSLMSKFERELLWEKSILFNNAYYFLQKPYITKINILKESTIEKNRRKNFKETKLYRKWYKKIKDVHPDWGTWNYGLNIGENNNPEFTKSESEGPSDSVGSDSILEDPKRQES